MKTLSFNGFTVTAKNPLEFLAQTGLKIKSNTPKPKTLYQNGWEDGYSAYSAWSDDSHSVPRSDDPRYLMGYDDGYTDAGLDW